MWTITTTLTKTDITPSVECRTTLLDLSRFVRIIKNFGEITLKLEIKLSETLTWDRGRPRVRLLRTLLRYEWSSSLKTCTWRDDVSRRFEFWAFATDVSNGRLNTSCSTTIDNETSSLRTTWSRRRIRYQIGYEKEVCVISFLCDLSMIFDALCVSTKLSVFVSRTSAYNVLIWGIDLSSRDWKIITTSLRRDIIEQGRLRAIQFWSIHFGQSIFVCCVVVGVDRCWLVCVVVVCVVLLCVVVSCGCLLLWLCVVVVVIRFGGVVVVWIALRSPHHRILSAGSPLLSDNPPPDPPPPDPPPSAGPPKISLFFFPLPSPFSLFVSLTVCLLVDFGDFCADRDAQMCTFGVFGFSCEVQGPRSRRSFTWQSERPNVLISGFLAFKNTTKIPRKDSQRGKKRTKMGVGEGKKKRNFGPPPPFGTPSFGTPPLWSPLGRWYFESHKVPLLLEVVSDESEMSFV